MSGAEPLRIAVIGAGGFGRHHVRILHGLASADLLAVVDSDPAVRERVAEQYGVPVLADASELPADVQAAVVAVPTEYHHDVALPLLERGVSVLVEKPMVQTREEGRSLVAAAEASGAVLQVGHVERFNPATRALREHEIAPRFIEATRVAPFSFRSADVGVVMDLMIHDIDLVLDLAGSPPVRVDAVGVPVLTRHEDIANARILFENGCVANLTASRVATKTERKLRVFSPASYLVVDFGARRGHLYAKSPELTIERVQELQAGAASLADLKGAVFSDLLTIEELNITEADALTDELDAFLACVRTGTEPEVSGRDGLAAVDVGLQIVEAIREALGRGA